MSNQNQVLACTLLLPTNKPRRAYHIAFEILLASYLPIIVDIYNFTILYSNKDCRGGEPTTLVSRKEVFREMDVVRIRRSPTVIIDHSYPICQVVTTFPDPCF